MDQPTSSPQEILDAELARLYERRLVVDELILCLERYASCTAKTTGRIPERVATTINQANAP